MVMRPKVFFKKNGGTILTCLGAAGVIGTAVTAVKATPKAMLLLNEAKKEKGESLTKLEMIKVAGPLYIPSVLIGVSSIACILGSNVLNKQKQAALVSAYTMLDQSYKEYKNKVVEMYGKEVDKAVEEELSKDNCPRTRWTSIIL